MFSFYCFGCQLSLSSWPPFPGAKCAQKREQVAKFYWLPTAMIFLAIPWGNLKLSFDLLLGARRKAAKGILHSFWGQRSAQPMKEGVSRERLLNGPLKFLGRQRGDTVTGGHQYYHTTVAAGPHQGRHEKVAKFQASKQKMRAFVFLSKWPSFLDNLSK